jgi:hypothetical protein
MGSEIEQPETASIHSTTAFRPNWTTECPRARHGERLNLAARCLMRSAQIDPVSLSTRSKAVTGPYVGITRPCFRLFR